MNLKAATRVRVPLSELGLPKQRKNPAKFKQAKLPLAQLGAIRSKAGTP